MYRIANKLNRYDDIVESLPIRQLDKPFEHHGDCVIIGDVQLPTTDYEFASYPLMIGAMFLKKPRTLILAGDFVNADAFKTYDDDIPSPRFQHEMEAARRFIEDCQKVFDEIIWFMGNHERRATKRTNGAIDPQILASIISHSGKLKVSTWGHCLVHTSKGTYRVLHGRNYSINQLTVADQLAQKYRQHIISHHEHHLAQGWDRYGHQLIVNNGGLFSQQDMSYAVLDDSKSANMKRGFTLLRNGVPHIYGDEPITDWDSIWSLWDNYIAKNEGK